MSRSLGIVVVALVLVVVPIVVGIAAGFRVRSGDSYRQTAVLAGICCLGITGLTLSVISVATPQTDCQNTGCDDGNAVGGLVIAVIMYGPSLLGVWLGRRGRRKRQAALLD